MLYSKEGVELVYQKGKLRLDNNGKKKVFLLYKMVPGLKKMACFFRLTERLFRLAPRCTIEIDSGVLFSWRGRVIKLDYTSEELTVEHYFRKGMSNPLYFTKLEGVDSFKKGILYGEYWGNVQKEEVCIWQRQETGQWCKVYSFTAGEVQHIHNILVDQKRARLLVFTGDSDEESGIWEIKENFSVVHKIYGGSQVYRSCVGFVCGDSIVYATDTPLQRNYVYEINPNIQKPKKIGELQGPCICGLEFVDQQGDKKYLFITSVEPDSRIKGWRYLLSYSLGEGVYDRRSYVNLLSDSGTIDVIFSGKKDILPMGAFQFGNFGCIKTNQGFALIGQAVQKYDGRTIKFEL